MNKLLYVRQLLMEVLEVGPSLLIGLVPLILLVLFHYAMLHILQQKIVLKKSYRFVELFTA